MYTKLPSKIFFPKKKKETKKADRGLPYVLLQLDLIGVVRSGWIWQELWVGGPPHNLFFLFFSKSFIIMIKLLCYNKT